MRQNHDTASEDPLLLQFAAHDDLEDCSSNEKYTTLCPTTTNWLVQLCRPATVAVLFCISVTSVVLNIYLMSAFSQQRQQQCTQSQHVPLAPNSSLQGHSAYTGLSLDTPSIHYHHTDFWSTNQTLADELWENIDTNPMVVALSDDFADAHSLPRSDRFPWDETKGRYFVKVFHQLHCLVGTTRYSLRYVPLTRREKFIRRAFADYQRGQPPRLNGQHVHHCLDTLRQDVMCIADDTPMPTGDEARAIGDEQPVMCRNFDDLLQWIYAPERNACHRALDDYRSITHSIERYAFCEQGTENYVNMKKYFDEHGHVDPWS